MQRSSKELHEKMSSIYQTERRLSAEFLELVKEFDARKLYLDFDCTSLFEYLTERLGYPPASAQRRIDSARLLKEIPELKHEIANGTLNLSQTAMLAKSIREKQKTSGAVETAQKREILEKLKNQNVATSELTISQMLNIPVKQYEVKRIQQDESLRVQMTFNREERELIEEYKNQISHADPNPEIKDLFVRLLRKALKKPVFGSKSLKRKQNAESPVTEALKLARRPESTSASEVATDHASAHPAYVPQPLRRQIFQEEQTCRWQYGSGKVCGKRFQLQADHIQPLWAGGKSERANLQVLCGIHNRLKYKLEAGIGPPES